MITETQKTADKRSSSALTIVGIGASAGGLTALKTFFSLIPPDSGLAYVIVMHLSPEHKSALAELLQPHVKMPVQQVNKTMQLERDHVYVIPPNANLNTIDTHLRLSDLEKQRRKRAPIDHFFRTLASTHDGNSVGIILTGTGSDGTLGIKEIKLQGGLTIVQDPEEAEFDGMPQSAIFSGQVDKVMTLKEIPPYLLKFVSTRPKLKVLDTAEEPEGEVRQLLQKVYAQVRARTGRDFSRYKSSTILRRLQRRMQLNQIERLENYVKMLRENTLEVHLLSDDFLINVTSFFRDTSVYQHLEEEVIPQIFDKKQLNEQIRVWSVGCATGEEAYSLGMLLIEEASRRETAPSLQVFASDLHEHSLKKARDGFYPGDIKVDVSEERLRRFFTKEDGGYRIRKELRELVIFTPHNLLGDPPFSRIDLIVCRNLLIYLKREVQRDVFELFHYSLRHNGTLILGGSEHLESADLFRTENKEFSIYTKRNVAGPEPRLPVFPTVQMGFQQESSKEREQPSLPYGALHQKMVERYGPPSILLSPDYQVMHVSDNAGRYLQIAGGELSRDAFKLVRPELQMELRSVIYAARESKKLTLSKPVKIVLEGQARQIILSARVIDEPSQENVILVLFEEYDKPSNIKEDSTAATSEGSNSEQVKELSQELQDTRQRLQAVIEEYETSREEMKASNEELQSANEELRSTLEELETSKEELQSMNEELTTLNQENRHKVEELSQMSDDLQNLMAATDIATLFLDKDLRILRFTPQLGVLFNVRPADRGRLISDQTHQLNYDELIADARLVIKKLIPVDREVKDKSGNTYLTRILPYRSSEDRIEGVVLTFIDITPRIEAEDQLRESSEQFRALVDASAQMVWTTNEKGEIAEDSPSWREFTGQTSIESKGYGWLNAVHPQDREVAEKNWRESIKEEKIVETAFRIRHKSGQWHHTTVRAVPLRKADGKVRGYVGMSIDITEQIQTARALQQSEEHLAAIFHEAEAGISEISAEGQFLRVNDKLCRILGRSREEILQLNIADVTLPEYLPQSQEALERLLKTAEPESVDKCYVKADGSKVWANSALSLLSNKERGQPSVLAVTVDLSEQRKAEEALRESEERLSQVLEQLPVGVGMLDRDGNWLLQTSLIRELTPNALPSRDPEEGAKWKTWDKEGGLVPPSEWPGPRALRGEVVSPGMEFLYTAEDGSERWIRVSSAPFRNEEGKPDGIIAVTDDITEQKRIAEELRKSEENRLLALESSDIGDWQLNPETNQLYWSKRVKQLLGVAPDTPEDFDLALERTYPEDRSRVLETISKAIGPEGTGEYDIEFRVIHPDGKLLWINSRAKTIKITGKEGRKTDFLFGAMVDITERKQSEEALKQAKHKAEEAARAKEEFLSTMSHEIRTPLNAINGLTSLLLQKEPRPDQEENLNTLKFSAQSLLMLINDILDFSKIEAGKVELEHIDYQLSTLINSIRQAHLPLAEGKDNELHFHIADNVPDVLRNDPHKLAQILNNLISNAIKFTEHGSIYLNVTLEKLEKDRVWLHFEVRDTGIGISEDKLQAIFEKFTQADSSTVRRYGGTGLGLSITKSLLELMGSEIMVESQEGEGSVFSFTLKEKIGNRANLKSAEHIYVESRKDAARLRRLKVLLVEDAEINRMVVLQHLEEWWGLKADEAINGREALEKAEKVDYDLILMDKRMPEMDGVEATRLIRKLSEHYARIPIIIMSADTSVGKELSGDGTKLFDAVVTKPFEPEKLMKTIISQIIDNGAAASAPSQKQKAEAEEDILTPNFSQAEKTFRNSAKQQKVFYEKTFDALRVFQKEYMEGMEKGDKQQLEDIMHKVKLLFNLLGLEAFYEKMQHVRYQIGAGTPTKTLSNEIDKVQRDLEEVITKVQQRLEELG